MQGEWDEELSVHSRSDANASTDRREAITIIFYAVGTRLIEPDDQHRKIEIEVFHPGQKPGEIAASELNPLLYTTEETHGILRLNSKYE
jgi:hypothetical protein